MNSSVVGTTCVESAILLAILLPLGFGKYLNFVTQHLRGGNVSDSLIVRAGIYPRRRWDHLLPMSHLYETVSDCAIIKDLPVKSNGNLSNFVNCPFNSFVLGDRSNWVSFSLLSLDIVVVGSSILKDFLLFGDWLSWSLATNSSFFPVVDNPRASSSSLSSDTLQLFQSICLKIRVMF